MLHFVLRLSGYYKAIGTGQRLILLVNGLDALGLAFASFYFRLQGLPLHGIVLVWALGPTVGMLAVALLNRFRVRRFMLVGSMMYSAKAAVLMFYFDYSFLLYGIIAGMSLAFFWVSVNFVFFARSDATRHARDSAFYFLAGPILGTLLPPIGATVIDALGYHTLFALLMVLSAIPVFYVLSAVPERRLQSSFGRSVAAFAGLRLITVLEGGLHYFRNTFVPLYALVFLTSEYAVGNFRSYVAFVGLVSAVVIARQSDQRRQRLTVAAPALVCMGLLIFALSVADTLVWWLPLVGMYALLDDATQPVRFALPMDLKDKTIGFWRASEFFGNLGRVICLGLAALFLYFDTPWPAFVIFGIVALGYPFAMRRASRSLTKRG